ncbi:MAG: ADP-ribosylglycohydrolase family protein [Limnochordia bacterium]
MRITWIKPEELLEHEYTQPQEEGNQVEELRAQWQEMKQQARDLAQLRHWTETFWQRLTVLEPGPWERDEPSELAAIFAAAAPERWPSFGDLDPAQVEDKIKGGWLGRAAGCLLGKPVEGKPRSWIRTLLEASGRWPLSDYFTAQGVPEEVFREYTWHRSYVEALKENIVCMPEDDDLNYSMLNLHVAEQFGPGFTPEDVLQTWLTTLPVLQVFTAERVAYLNALRLLEPPETARFRNPYREWIGAQIRADLWGWIAPGNPRLAAELAYRDAIISHTKNGIYGEMFVAAMIAASFTLTEIRDIIQVGLSFIPAKSRLSEAIRFTLSLYDAGGHSFESAMDKISERYGRYHWVHTINNAALVTAALLFGKGDFERSICYAVMGGWDTDCNGATVGSIVGVLLGAAALPQKWIAPLNNRIRTSLQGFDNSSFDQLARRTLLQAERFDSISTKE